MRIAIPVNDRDMESGVCQSFGRAPYFLIHDGEADQCEFLDNSAASTQGGAGIRAAQAIIDRKVSALLTPRCGQNAAEVFKAADVKIYRTESESIQDTLKAYQEEKLSLLEEIHSGFHQHRGR